MIRAAIDAGLRVEPVPGASAVLTALAASGLPTEAFCFLGFPPTRSKDRKLWFERLNAVRGTIVFFEAPHRIQATLHELLREVGDCEAVVGRELTKMHEQITRAPIAELARAADKLETRGEFVLVVAPPRPDSLIMTDDALDDLLRASLARDSVKDSVAHAVELSGRPRREVYARALELAKEVRGDDGED